LSLTRRMPSPGGDRGQVLILTALSMTVLLGVAALTLDASFMYDKRNKLGPPRPRANGAMRTGTLACSRRTRSVRRSGGADATTSTRQSGTTVIVNHPPLSGPYTATSITSRSTRRSPSTFIGVLSMVQHHARRSCGGRHESAAPCITRWPRLEHLISFSPGASSVLTMPAAPSSRRHLNVQ
jgi:hypothetical protein